MPLYDYRARDQGCPHCEGTFDVIQKLGAAHLTECPECGAPVERLLNGAAIGKSKAMAMKHLQKAGFTQYNKAGRDQYERVSGSSGPDAIVRKE